MTHVRHSAGSFSGFRRSSPAPKVSDVLSEKVRSRRSSRRVLRAQQQQQVPSDTEPDTQPGWDKLSSDDFATWVGNGGRPATPLLVRPWHLLDSSIKTATIASTSATSRVSFTFLFMRAGYCELSSAPEEFQPQPAQAAVQGAALRHRAHCVQDWGYFSHDVPTSCPDHKHCIQICMPSCRHPLPFTHFCLCEPSVQVIWGHLSVWWN